MSGITTEYSNCVGSADYFYKTSNANAYTNFLVNSIALNKEQPLNLYFNHEFFSSALSKEENDKFIEELTTVLNSINAKNITTNITQNTPTAQSIFVNYNIDNVEQSKVDTLTTTIAKVCDKAIEEISIKFPCSTSTLNNLGSASVDGETYYNCQTYSATTCYNNCLYKINPQPFLRIPADGQYCGNFCKCPVWNLPNIIKK
jgi:hypothetical protein